MTIYDRPPLNKTGIPVFAETDEYTENYERIAALHLDHYRQYGSNPWMADDLVGDLDNYTLAAIRRHVPTGSAILDVGCGTGRLLSQLGAYDRFGCDISTAYLREAGQHADVCMARIEDLPYQDETFDAAVCTDVLEHVLDFNACVTEILRVLQPGGTFIVRCPDTENLAPYINYEHRFVHLRILSTDMIRLAFDRVFDCSVIETGHVRGEAAAVILKRPGLVGHALVDGVPAPPDNPGAMPTARQQRIYS